MKRANGLGKPVLVLRAKTERPEGVAAGTLKPALSFPKGWREPPKPKLAAAERSRSIVNEAARLLDDDNVYAKLVLSVPKGWRRQSTPAAMDGRQQEL